MTNKQIAVLIVSIFVAIGIGVAINIAHNNSVRAQQTKHEEDQKYQERMDKLSDSNWKCMASGACKW